MTTLNQGADWVGVVQSHNWCGYATLWAGWITGTTGLCPSSWVEELGQEADVQTTAVLVQRWVRHARSSYELSGKQRRRTKSTWRPDRGGFLKSYHYHFLRPFFRGFAQNKTTFKKLAKTQRVNFVLFLYTKHLTSFSGKSWENWKSWENGEFLALL